MATFNRRKSFDDIRDEMIARDFERSNRAPLGPPETGPYVSLMSKHERVGILQRMRQRFAEMTSDRGDSREWAVRLKEREDAGEILLPIQRQMWRQALGARAYVSDAPLDDAVIAQRKREAEAKVRAYVAELDGPPAGHPATDPDDVPW